MTCFRKTKKWFLNNQKQKTIIKMRQTKHEQNEGQYNNMKVSINHTRRLLKGTALQKE